VTRFGRIDTWINNPAITTYGTFEGLITEKMERIIRVNL